MKYYLVNALLFIACVTYAQVNPRNILATHYSLEAIQSALVARTAWTPYPKTPEAWQKALPDSLQQELIKAGEVAAQKEFASLPATLTLEYVRTANRTRYEQVSFGKRNQLLTLALAESIEGKGRFLDAVLNGVWSICEESFWGIPAHLGGQKMGSGLPNVEDRTVDLFAAETAATLALTDYLLGDQLAKASPLVRPRIYYETNQRLFEPLTTQPDRYGYLKKGAKVNNWNPWIMANWLTATLLLESDANRRSQMTHSAMEGLDLYLNGLGDDGGCDEGPSYWFAAGACVFDALELLHSATNGKVDIYQEPLIRNMASYVYKMHIAQDYFVDFADADPTLKPDGLMLYRFGKRIQDDTLARFGQWAYRAFGNVASNNGFHRQRRVQNLLAVTAITAQAAATFHEVSNVWFADVQVMTARSDKGLYVATHGGHNDESHNHNDVGDFILYANGKPIVIDVGRGTYTANTFSGKRYSLWYTQSNFHNLPIINGAGQPAGRAFEAQNVRYSLTPKGASLAMNLAKAYPSTADVQTWNRTVQLDRRTESVLITDDYILGKTPNSVQQSLMTICPLDTSVPGKITFKTPERNVVLQYDPKSWKATVETVPLTTIDDEAFNRNWGGKPIQRILLTKTALSAKGKTTFRFAWE
ncbi:heparinase II/III family protein [Spirosoma sp. KNUC1025]|uniref:heparinase II/III domain-containing protein n=1 Tax=Spirosoma sp. KNUC1025 TaxID=2894082 RepID=UPI00386B970B|nr:heparinase II/III-family protein [Spirosoma sp. KNUC1025]